MRKGHSAFPMRSEMSPPPLVRADTNTHVCAAYDRMCIMGLPFSKVVNFATLVTFKLVNYGLLQDSKYLPLVMHESATSKITNEVAECLILRWKVEQMFEKLQKFMFPKAGGRRRRPGLRLRIRLGALFHT